MSALLQSTIEGLGVMGTTSGASDLMIGSSVRPTVIGSRASQVGAPMLEPATHR
jgi:hypothetical protein